MDSNSNTMATCPFCRSSILASELQRHANGHFDDNDEQQLAKDFELAQQLSLIESNNNNHQNPHAISPKFSSLLATQLRATFYQTENEPLMQLLKNCLQSEENSAVTLLSGHVDHSQCVEGEDVGWGCGWRNVQMLCSHLVECREDVRCNVFGGCGFVPGIGSLQRWLEFAWEMGFDVDGAEQFGGKVYGTRKWIGATECAALLRSFGVRARVVDFSPGELVRFVESVPGVEKGKCKGKAKFSGPMDRFVKKRERDSFERGSTSRNENMESDVKGQSRGSQVLIDWVWNYFSDGQSISCGDQCRVVATGKPPLYFQHDGHSRTIVGIQVRHQRNGMLEYNLLILDPGHRTADLERSLKRNIGWQRLIKRGVHTLKKPQYQLCYIDPGIASGLEIEQMKTIQSVLYEI